MAFTSKHVYLCITTGLCAVIATSYIFIGRNKYISIGNILQDSKWNTNKIRECQSCPGNVPNYIIQYGPARTATTLQFHILCLCMAVLHEDEKKFVGCYFEKDIPVATKYTVTKTHTISKFLTTAIPSNSWIFMTSSDALSPKRKHQLNLNKRKIKEHNITIPYVADVSLVSKRGYFIAYEYQSIFGLSDDKMQHIVEYLRYWDILRLCCGKQMSQDWRNHLSPNPNYKRHHDTHSSTYPSCEIYNISKVEQNLLNTYVFKLFKHVVSLRNFIGKPSVVDGILNGNYCARCNTHIAKQHLKFNDICV